MVIAVTGAAGRVGGFVVDELIQSGHDVVAVDLREPLVAATETRRADIQDLATLADALRGCEAIVHLAAIAEEGLAPPDFTFAVNAQGTVNCLEAAVKVGRKSSFMPPPRRCWASLTEPAISSPTTSRSTRSTRSAHRTATGWQNRS